MWPYLYEPRSKYWYDDDESGGGESSWDWSCILWSPVILVGLLLVGISPLLYLTGYFFYDVYYTLKRTVNSGKLSYPFLTFAGGAVALLLAFAYLAHPKDKPIPISVYLMLAIGFVIIFTILPILALCLHHILKTHSFLKTRLGGRSTLGLYFALLVTGLVAIMMIGNLLSKYTPITLPANPTPEITDSLPAIVATQVSQPTSIPLPGRTISILVDDFTPQPYQGDALYFYNRLEGDRGALNNSRLDWGMGQVRATITDGNSWGGIWMSLSHPIRENLGVNFSALLPAQILPRYQASITGITVQIESGTPGKTFRVELKDGSDLRWANEITLTGGQQNLSADLHPLQNISQLVLVLDRASTRDFVTVDRISLTASTPVEDTAAAAFIWSYGMLLRNWDPSTGLVRDKAKESSGEFDALQATGSLAAATAVAEQLGLLQREDAVAIVSKISETLLTRIPRSHGLWPHWVKILPGGEFIIVPNTEWSSVDTVIAAIGLLGAQQSLGLNTSGIEQLLHEIEWDSLVTEKGISHGYTYSGELIPYPWDTFGGENWLVELAYAAATGQVALLAYPTAATANGSGFIDELAWLYVQPPAHPDYWGVDWQSYRNQAATKQMAYYNTSDPIPCFGQLGLFGLSAAEVPAPAKVAKEAIYQAFGVGGQFTPANDGAALLGSPVIAPHYSAMIASLHHEAAIKLWDWLINNGYFSPLNNVESLTFPTHSTCTPDDVEWNQLKGSWNLALQTLGWGRYLAERQGKVPVLWQATKANPFLRNGYQLLVPDEPSSIMQPLDQDLSTLLHDLEYSCEGEPLSNWGLPGIYRYKITTSEGGSKIDSVERTSATNPGYAGYSLSLFGEALSPRSVSQTTEEAASITTQFGTFAARRVDTTHQYRVQTMNHSDPGEIIQISEWYVCGVGVIRATLEHQKFYQTRIFQLPSLSLELVSFTALP